MTVEGVLRAEAIRRCDSAAPAGETGSRLSPGPTKPRFCAATSSGRAKLDQARPVGSRRLSTGADIIRPYRVSQILKSAVIVYYNLQPVLPLEFKNTFLSIEKI